MNGSYIISSPPQIFQHCIDRISIQKHCEIDRYLDNEPTTLVPTTMMDLVFHFGDPFERETPNGFETLPHFYLTGQKNRPDRVRAKGTTGIIIISLMPWAAHQLFGFSVQEIKNEITDLDHLIARKLLLPFKERFFGAQSGKQRVSMILNLIQEVETGSEQTKKLALVKEACSSLNQQFGNVSIDDLSKKYGLHRRSLARNFNEIVGLSPKEFAQIIRFQKSLQLTKANRFTDVCFDWLGYFDQSHYLKDLKSYTGKSRKELILNMGNSPLKGHFNFNQRLSHFYNTVYL